MSMRPFTIKGDIKLTNRRIYIKNSECYGTAEVDGRRFKIRMSNKAITDGVEFMDTCLHELLHLWLAISMEALDFKLSDAASHRIIERTSSRIAQKFNQEYFRKRKRK